jgi:hypothetical protein
MGWTLDVFFGKETEQMVTLRDVQRVSDLASRILARAKQTTSITAASGRLFAILGAKPFLDRRYASYAEGDLPERAFLSVAQSAAARHVPSQHVAVTKDVAPSLPSFSY